MTHGDFGGTFLEIEKKEAYEAEDTVIFLLLQALRHDSRQLAAHRLRTAGLYAIGVAK